MNSYETDLALSRDIAAAIAEAGGRYAVYNIWGTYDTRADVLEKADYLNDLSAIAQKSGIALLYHNHAEEFAMLDDKLNIHNVEKYLAVIAANSGKGIYLDDGTLVGRLLPAIDSGLGQTQKLNARLSL